MPLISKFLNNSKMRQTIFSNGNPFEANRNLMYNWYINIINIITAGNFCDTFSKFTKKLKSNFLKLIKKTYIILKYFVAKKNTKYFDNLKQKCPNISNSDKRKKKSIMYNFFSWKTKRFSVYLKLFCRRRS